MTEKRPTEHRGSSMTRDMNAPRTPRLHPSWLAHLEHYFHDESMKTLKAFLVEEQRQAQVFPPNRLIFNAFNTTPLSQVKVVILGQDPYHGPGQAHGLSFSVPSGVYPPPSLLNIFQELVNDVGVPMPTSGDLSDWARRGVLLLNTALTVRARAANSHRGQGWESFTDEVIRVVNKERERVVFMLWGRNARQKKNLIDTQRHFIIESPHPSPYSANSGFFGSRPFSRANQFLRTHGHSPIDWRLS